MNEKDMLGLIKQLIEYPTGKVCKHWAAFNILSLMETKGMKLPKGLVNSIGMASEGDEKSLKILSKSLDKI